MGFNFIIELFLKELITFTIDFYKMKLFSWSLRFNGFPMKEAKADFESIQSIPDEEYKDYVNIKKREILDFHLKNNTFYKKHTEGFSTDNWDNVPVLTKKDFQQPLKQRLSDGYSYKNQYVNKTSGSSGNPFIFAKDKYCHALTWHEFIDRYSWYNIDLDDSYQARFYGIPLQKVSYYKERFKDWLSHRYRFSVFNLSADAMKENLNLFKYQKFEYINGYTSAIVQFAKYLEQKNVVLSKVCPTLKCCIVTSEMLYEKDRVLLEKQFNLPIVNEYGAAEVGLIAFKNTDHNWMVNSETIFVEILDENNNALPYGKEGKIVITSLYNKAHPIIRYELGDIGVLDEKSTPKYPILKKLIGRTSDIITLPSGKKAAGLTFYYITKTVIEDDAKVKEFVITQLKQDLFRISYVSTEELTETQIKDINKAVETYLEPELRLEFEKVEVLKRAKSGKLKQFTSLV
jgi:phenylacetate-CoA ligase